MKIVSLFILNLLKVIAALFAMCIAGIVIGVWFCICFAVNGLPAWLMISTVILTLLAVAAVLTFTDQKKPAA